MALAVKRSGRARHPPHHRAPSLFSSFFPFSSVIAVCLVHTSVPLSPPDTTLALLSLLHPLATRLFDDFLAVFNLHYSRQRFGRAISGAALHSLMPRAVSRAHRFSRPFLATTSLKLLLWRPHTNTPNRRTFALIKVLHMCVLSPL